MCSNVSALLDFNSWSVKADPPMLTGGCAPKGGDPTGQVQPQGATTFCCK